MRMGEYLSVTTGEIGLILVTGDDVATVAELQKVVWSVCVLGGESNSSLALTIKGEKLFRHDWRGRNGALYSLDCCLLSGASASLGYCRSSP